LCARLLRCSLHGMSQFPAHVQVLFNSLVVSTLFFRTTLHPNSAQEGNFYLGVLFFSLIHIMCACHLASMNYVLCYMRAARVACMSSQRCSSWSDHALISKGLRGF